MNPNSIQKLNANVGDDPALGGQFCISRRNERICQCDTKLAGQMVITEKHTLKKQIAASQTPSVNSAGGRIQPDNQAYPATTEKLLGILRKIAAFENENKRASVSVNDAEELCNLGLATSYGHGKYAITGEGKVVLKKTCKDAFPLL